MSTRRHKSNSKKGRKSKYSHRRNAFPQQRSFSPALSRTLISPDQMDVRLKFRSTGALVATGFSAKRYTPNAAYDVDPILGSTETIGFDEYAALYSYYRVVKYHYRISVTNCNPTSAAMFYVLNTNTDPSIAGTRYDLYSTNPHCQTKLLPPHPQGKQEIFQKTFSVSRVLGSGVVETDDSYRSLTTGIPSDLVWLTMAAETLPTSGADNTINIAYVVDVVMSIRFYSREVDLSLAGMQRKLNLLKIARIKSELSRLEASCGPLKVGELQRVSDLKAQLIGLESSA